VQTFRDVITHRFILQNLVAKELKSLYRNQALGFLWTLLNPLVLIVVLTFVWVVFFGNDLSFPPNVLVALIPFNFFAYSLSGCSHSILANANLVKKVHFPRQIIPFSVVITHFVHFLVQSSLILAVLLLFPVKGEILTWRLLWIPCLVTLQFAMCLGIGLLVAGLNVVYRDVQYIVDSVLTVLFWACPIVYEATAKLQDHGRWLYYLYFMNPLAGLLESYRSVLYYGQSPPLEILALTVGVSLVLGCLGVWSFWRHEREFADLI
jgi:ABC-2 type transport system permease protein